MMFLAMTNGFVETFLPRPAYSLWICRRDFTISNGWMQHVATIPERAPRKYGLTGVMMLKKGVRMPEAKRAGYSGVSSAILRFDVLI